jgi:hypothetical protein
VDEAAHLGSKVLVLESNDAYFDRIKIFCDNNNLFGVTAQADGVINVLKANIDFGAILLSENFSGSANGGIELARKIHRTRPELPIFLRRETSSTLDGLPEKDRKNFAVAYTIDTIDDLKKHVDEYIFSFVYPNAMVRGIEEISVPALECLFQSASVETEAPYIVRDRLIFGEVFSLIPLESTWCRGYMMLQCGGNDLNHIIAKSLDVKKLTRNDFRMINQMLGEATNMIWGGFKNRYFPEESKRDGLRTQVPLIINHEHNYISFGAENPQLCFKYTLVDKNDPDAPAAIIFQRFIFNLFWSPEEFKDLQSSMESLVDSGELELF